MLSLSWCFPPSYYLLLLSLLLSLTAWDLLAVDFWLDVLLEAMV